MSTKKFENYHIEYLIPESNTFQEGNDTIYKNGGARSWNYNKSTKSGWGLDPATDSVLNNLTVLGIITGSEIHIPNTTYQASFHVNMEGDLWLGCNVDNWETVELLDNKWIHPNALSYIENNGFAKFQDMMVGGFRIGDDLYPLSGGIIKTSYSNPKVSMSESSGLTITNSILDINNSIISVDSSSTISGDLIPNITDSYSLGNSNKYWLYGYFTKIFADEIIVGAEDMLKVLSYPVVYTKGNSSNTHKTSGFLSTSNGGGGTYSVSGNPYGGSVTIPEHNHLFSVDIYYDKIPARINATDTYFTLEITSIT